MKTIGRKNMPGIRILLGNEPRAYRDALAAAFRALRPDLDVLTVEPLDIEQEAALLSPQLVISSDVAEAMRIAAPAWVVLYPNGAPLAVISIAGEQSTSNDLGLEALLFIIDRVRQIV